MYKLNLIAPINPLGYGVVGLNILKQAVSRFDVSLFPISNISVSDQKDLEIVEKAICFFFFLHLKLSF